MVAIFTGNGSGFERGSGNVLGATGLLGSASLGRGDEQLFLNAANGNLLLQHSDEFLVGRGPDVAVNRSYNSLGNFSDENGDNWRQSTDRRIFGYTGTGTYDNGTVKRRSADGSEIVYTWRSINGVSAFWAADGAGAYDKLTYSGGTWTWTDGDTQTTESYEATNAAPTTEWRLKTIADTLGNALTFTYLALSDRTDKVTTADGAYVQYSWSGSNITQIVTGYTDLATSTAKTLTRTRYAYDGSNRLTSVTADLSPGDNSVSDGSVYVTTYTYDGTSKRVASITQTDGSSVAILYDGSGRVTTLTQTASTGVTRVTTVDYQTGYTRITDPLGQVTRLDYDTAGQLTKITAPPAYTGATAQVTQFAYNANGDVTSTTDAAGAVTSFTYVDPLVPSYDDTGEGLTNTDRTGAVVKRSYDAKNSLLTETRTGSDKDSAAATHTDRYAYNGNNLMRFAVTADGGVTEFRYDTYGREVLRIVYTDQAYDLTGLADNQAPSEATLAAWVAAISDLSSIQQTVTDYDARGNVGKVTTYSTLPTGGGGSTGTPQTIVNGANMSVVAQGDGTYRITRTGGGFLSWVADARSPVTVTGDLVVQVRPVSFTEAGAGISHNPAASTTLSDIDYGVYLWGDGTAHYTEAGTVGSLGTFVIGDSFWVVRSGTSVSYYKGATLTAAIAAGALRTVSGATGTFGFDGCVYNKFGQLDVAFTDGIPSAPAIPLDSHIVNYVYDQAGRLLSSATAGLPNQTFIYDGMGRITASTDPNGATTSIVFSDSASQTVVTSANGLVRTSTYNKAGELISTLESGSYVTGGTATRAYDKLGNLRMSTDATGHNGYSVFDKAGRKVADIDHYGSIVEYRYDSDDRVIATTRYANRVTSAQIITLQDPNSVIEMSTLRPTTTTADITTRKIYDAEGRTIEAIEGDGSVTTYAYDGSGQLTAITVYANKLAAATLTGFFTTPPTGLVTPTADPTHDSVARNFYNKAGALIGTLDGEGYLRQFVYDKSGRKIADTAYATITAAGSRATGTFSTLLTSVGTSASDRTTRFIYDGQSQLRYQIDALNHVTEYGYDTGASGQSMGLVRQTTQYAGTLGALSSYTYASVRAAMASLASNPDNRSNWMIYDNAGQLVYSIDALNQVTAMFYDADGNVVKTYAGSGQRPTFALPDLASMNTWYASNVTTNYGVTRSYYSARGDLMFEVDSEGFVTGYTYDAEGRVLITTQWDTAIAVTDSTTIATVASLATGTSATTTTAYDMDGNVSDFYDGVGNRHSWFYNANGTLAYDILCYGQADESRTAYIYDAAGRVTGKYGAYGTPEQTLTQYAYDGFGNIVTATDPKNNVTTNSYDKLGRLVGRTDALSGLTTFQYNAFGEVVKTTDPRGSATYTYYDAIGRVVSTRDAEDYVTETAYSAFGETVSATRRGNKATNTASVTALPVYTADPAKDAVTSFLFDRLGRLICTTDALGYTEMSQLNSFNERIAFSSKLDYFYTNATLYYYDKRGKLTSEVGYAHALGSGGGVNDTVVTTTYKYDARGNLIKKIEGDGLSIARTTTYVYDKANRLIETDLPQVSNATNTGLVTPVEYVKYDGRGNVIEKTDAAGARTLFWYDHLDRLISQLSPVGTLTEFSYDKNGNVTSTRVYSTPVALPGTPGGTPPASSLGGAYRETTQTYDALDRTLTVNVLGVRTGNWNGSTYALPTSTTLTTTYQYDAAGNVVKTTDAVGGLIYSYYDKLNRKTATVDALGYMTAWTLDQGGNALTERRYALAASGMTVTAPPSVATNGADRVTNFTYDLMGQRLTEQRLAVQSYTIDSSGTLTSVPSGTSTVTYTYNAAGQVLTKTEATGDVTSYVYDSQGLLETETRAAYTSVASGTVAPTVNYVYDALGDLVRTTQGNATPAAGDRVTNYTYGAGGRLATMTDPTGAVRTYFYDIAGRKIGEQYGRIDSAGTTHQEGMSYQYDLTGNVTRQAYATVSSGVFTDAGEITTLAYDSFGELLSRSIKAAGAGASVLQEQNAYDSAGRLWRTNAQDGVWRFFMYDANGNQTLTIESEGTNLAGMTLQNVLDIATVTGTSTVGATYIDGINATITAYDLRNQAVSTIQTKRQRTASGTQDLVTAQGYNAFGEVAWDRDVRTASPTSTNIYTYNTMGRMVSVQHALVTVGNADGTTTSGVRPTETYYYDISGRAIGQVDANGNLTRRTLLAGTGYGQTEALAVREIHTDGGTIVNDYNVYGDLVSVQGELGAWTDAMVYDDDGRIKQYSHGSGLIEYWTYDALGQRVTHWNNVLGSGNVEKTDYDVQGRVISQVAFGGDTTTNTYVWNGSLVTAGLSTTAFGGYTQTTTYANSKTSVEQTDGFDHVISKTDMGGRTTYFTYDMAGRTTETAGGITQRYTYFNTGLAASVSTGTGTGGGYVENAHADYTYDVAGKKLTEYATSGGVIIENATATYDALGRMATWSEAGNVTTPAANISWTYDAAGNIRRENATYTTLTATGTAGSAQTKDQWFRYDSMNRVVTANGIVVGGVIVRGYTGTDILYNVSGQRVQVINTVTSTGKVRREDYSYTNGNLTQVGIAEATYTDNFNGTVTVSLPGSDDLKATYTYDGMNRLTRQQDWTGNGGGVAVDHQMTYDARGLVTTDVNSQLQGSDTYVSTATNNYGSGTGYALGALVSSTTTNSKNGTTQPTTSTTNSFYWYDGAVQASVAYKPDVTQSTTFTTGYTYNNAGIFLSANVADGRPRTITATNNALGQVIRRDESDTNFTAGDPHEVWYRFDGVEIGHVSNNGTLETDYRTSIDTRTAASAGTGAFRNGASTGVSAADFGSGYDPINSYEQLSSMGTYTVRTGDTLAGIAAQVWGDASLWYKLAEANGLSANSALIEGQSILLPSGVVRSANTASTFKPYNPTDALGDSSPTTPKPQAKKNKCGIFGQILLAAIAVAVSIALPGGGSVIGAAINAAIGSAVSQVVGIATGIQQKFDFKGLALSALTAGVAAGVGQLADAAGKLGGALGKIGRFVGGSSFGSALVRGALSNAVTQGISVATGLQKKFNFTGVAVAGISAGVSAAVGGALPGHAERLLGGKMNPATHLNQLGASLAGGIAGAATRSVLDGTDFGDNILAVLPGIIGRNLGRIAGDALTGGGRMSPDEVRAYEAGVRAEWQAAADARGAGAYTGQGAVIHQHPPQEGQQQDEIVVTGQTVPAQSTTAKTGSDDIVVVGQVAKPKKPKKQKVQLPTFLDLNVDKSTYDANFKTYWKGIQANPKAKGNINGNGAVASEAQKTAQITGGPANVAGDKDAAHFLLSILKETAGAGITGSDDYEKFVTIRPNGAGGFTIVRIGVLGENGGRFSPPSDGQGMHIHYYGMAQPPHGADQNSVLQNGKATYVGSYAGNLWEVARNNGDVQIRQVLPSGYGPWENYQIDPANYKIYSMTKYPPY